MTKVVFFVIVMLYVLNPLSVNAKIYKFVDENGQVHYSQKKPVNNKKSQRLDINSKRLLKKIRLLPNKHIDKAVREGKITETIATRMRYFNFVSEEFVLLKKKKKAMKLAIKAAKSRRSGVSAEHVKNLKQEYDVFVKEEYYYKRRNYTVSRKKLRALLSIHNKKNQGVSIRNSMSSKRPQ